jgi:hypothetical protein
MLVEDPDPNTPLLVSYPRSGSRWINALAEVYFDRARAPAQQGGISWVERREGEPFMWHHVHDKVLTIPESLAPCGDLFLFRNPTHCLFSLWKVEADYKWKVENSSIETEAAAYLGLFEKWISRARTVLVYEKAVEDPAGCLRLMSEHFGLPWNGSRAELAIHTCTKEAVMSKLQTLGVYDIYHNSSVLSDEYAQERESFYRENNQQILSWVLTDKTTPYLQRYAA